MDIKYSEVDNTVIVIESSETGNHLEDWLPKHYCNSMISATLPSGVYDHSFLLTEGISPQWNINLKFEKEMVSADILTTVDDWIMLARNKKKHLCKI